MSCGEFPKGCSEPAVVVTAYRPVLLSGRMDTGGDTHEEAAAHKAGS